MFPSVACSSYFGYFVEFSRGGLISVEIRFKRSILKRLNPTSFFLFRRKKWWAQVDSNHRPHDYQSCALAS